MEDAYEENNHLESCLARKTKKTDLVTAKDLFSNTKLGENCFRIPDYQRGYAWRSEFEVFWKDILRIFKSSNAGQSHYTGMLVLEEMDSDAKNAESLSFDRNAFYVADGQQRLTSIVIILQSLFEYIKEETNGKDDLSAEYLVFGNNEYRFNYSVERRDTAKNFFENRIFRSDANIKCLDMYSKNIDHAKRFIDESLKMFDVDEAKALLDIVLNKMLFNIYFISDFDVRVTFETMNNRGKQLTKLELLKNRLMYLSSFLTDSSSENRLKETINNAWKDIYENLGMGEDKSESDDEYLRAHWFIYHGYNKGENDKYIKEILDDAFAIDEGKFHELISNSKHDEAFSYIENYSKSLGMFSKYWLAVNHPSKATNLNLSSDEQIWMDKLRRIPLNKTYIKPAIMAVCGEQLSFVSQAEKVMFYQTLEKTIFIYKLLGFNDDDNFSPVLKHASDLFKAKTREEKRKAYKELLQESQAFTKETPYKDVVRKAIIKLGEKLNDNNPKFFYSWGGLTYFLYEYDLQLGDGKRIVWDLIKKGDSIEHIMPQDIEKRNYWKLVIDGMDESERIHLTNSLGNLLLLSTSDNSYLSNHSFPVKKGLTSEHRYGYRFGTRSEIEVADNEFWTPHQIFIRQKKMFNTMYMRWIYDGSNSITQSEFMDMLAENGLLVADRKEISDECKIVLRSIDYSSEAEPMAEEKITNQSKIEKEELKSYFDQEKYHIRFNNRNTSHIKDFFALVMKEKEIVCGTATDQRNYTIVYSKDNSIIKVGSFKEGWSDYVIEEDEYVLPEIVKYYIRTLRRYLRRKGYGEAPLYIYQPTPEERTRNLLTQKIVAKLCELKEIAGLEMLTKDDKKFVRFTTKVIREKGGLCGRHTGSWSKIHDLLVFEISNDAKNGASIILYIGPSNDHCSRNKWFNFGRHISKTNPLFKNKTKIGKDWSALTKSFFVVSDPTHYDDEEKYFLTAINNLETFIKVTLLEIEKEFKNAPDNETDPVYLD